jgi:hypothetical protein
MRSTGSARQRPARQAQQSAAAGKGTRRGPGLGRPDGRGRTAEGDTDTQQECSRGAFGPWPRRPGQAGGHHTGRTCTAHAAGERRPGAAGTGGREAQDEQGGADGRFGPCAQTAEDGTGHERQEGQEQQRGERATVSDRMRGRGDPCAGGEVPPASVPFTLRA